jgi:hypothetical protein
MPSGRGHRRGQNPVSTLTCCRGDRPECPQVRRLGDERPQGPATSVIAAGQHQRERIHRERARFTRSRREEDPARIIGRACLGRGVGDKGGPTSFEVGGEGGPGLGLEGDVEGLVALRPPEADQRPLEVEIARAEKADARIASGCRFEDRGDHPVAQIERSIPIAAWAQTDVPWCAWNTWRPRSASTPVCLDPRCRLSAGASRGSWSSRRSHPAVASAWR